MSARPPLLRSRTSSKIVEIKLDRYKPRDWDYQNPKHQVIPQFVLGRYKKATPYYYERVFPNHKIYFSPDADDRRELKPAIFRSYILSQISTLPGAVLVEEGQIHDDQFKEERKKEVKKRTEAYINKILQDYGSNVENLPGSKKNGKKLLPTSNSTQNIKVIKVNGNKEETKKPEEENKGEKVEKIKVNLKLKGPIKREKKLKVKSEKK